MTRLRNCFCCCNLKYGFFGFGVLTLLFRICVTFALLSTQQMLVATISSSNLGALDNLGFILPGVATLMGWLIGTSVVLFVALLGIVQKRAILMFPYIVVLVTELILLVVVSLAATLSSDYPVFLIKIPIFGVINGYSLWCLISLFAETNEYQMRSSQMGFQDVPYKTV